MRARTVGVIKATRGQELVIDLNVDLTGGLSWMRHRQTGIFRQLDIVGETIVLPLDKSLDYIDVGGNVIESMKGSWDYEVRLDDRVAYHGVIMFRNNITGATEIEGTPESPPRQNENDFT